VKHCDTPVGGQPGRQGLYDPSLEHDACGVGFVAHIKNKKSHDIVRQGLRILDNLTHRGATGYDPLLGDGAGILIQMPDEFLRAEAARIGLSLPVVGEYACGMVFLPQSANGRMGSTCPRCRPALVYKGMLLANQVGEYYLDLQDPRLRFRRWRWCTSASPPTPSRPGTWPTPSA
jgi:glutamate synthase domain-containing protein 1